MPTLRNSKKIFNQQQLRLQCCPQDNHIHILIVPCVKIIDFWNWKAIPENMGNVQAVIGIIIY